MSAFAIVSVIVSGDLTMIFVSESNLNLSINPDKARTDVPFDYINDN